MFNVTISVPREMKRYLETLSKETGVKPLLLWALAAVLAYANGAPVGEDDIKANEYLGTLDRLPAPLQLSLLAITDGANSLYEVVKKANTYASVGIHYLNGMIRDVKGDFVEQLFSEVVSKLGG